MQTSRGVFLNLKDSTYKCERYGITFYFSSLYYLNKFIREYQEYVDNENMKIEVRYKIPINFRKYLMIAYYKRIEKRGFRIIINKKEFLHPTTCEVLI